MGTDLVEPSVVVRWRMLGSESDMIHTPRFHVGPRYRVPADLEELGRRVERLPEPHRGELLPLYDRLNESFRLRNRILAVAKEALEQIRLEVSCLKFDLHATQLENDELKRRIEE